MLQYQMRQEAGSAELQNHSNADKPDSLAKTYTPVAASTSALARITNPDFAESEPGTVKKILNVIMPVLAFIGICILGIGASNENNPTKAIGIVIFLIISIYLLIGWFDRLVLKAAAAAVFLAAGGVYWWFISQVSSTELADYAIFMMLAYAVSPILASCARFLFDDAWKNTAAIIYAAAFISVTLFFGTAFGKIIFGILLFIAVLGMFVRAMSDRKRRRRY